jgi:hypothetical protein
MVRRGEWRTPTLWSVVGATNGTAMGAMASAVKWSAMCAVMGAVSDGAVRALTLLQARGLVVQLWRPLLPPFSDAQILRRKSRSRTGLLYAGDESESSTRR